MVRPPSLSGATPPDWFQGASSVSHKSLILFFSWRTSSRALSFPGQKGYPGSVTKLNHRAPTAPWALWPIVGRAPLGPTKDHAQGKQGCSSDVQRGLFAAVPGLTF